MLLVASSDGLYQDGSGYLCHSGAWIEKNREILPPLSFDCGTGDQLIEGNRRFHKELKRRGISHQYVESDGRHDWSYWSAHMSSSFLFFENILGEPPNLLWNLSILGT